MRHLHYPILLLLLISTFGCSNDKPNEATLILDVKANLGEGAFWHPEEQLFYWIDIYEGKLHRYDPETAINTTIDVGAIIGTVVPTDQGDAIVALNTGIHIVELDSGNLTYLTNPLPDAGVRFNDGKCDPSGRFWVGSMAMDSREKGASLYRFDGDSTAVEVLDGVTVSNGIVWTSDRKTMYYNDSPTRTIQAFDYDDASGEISNRRVAVEIPEAMGLPDGMTIDSEDKLWVAMWDGSAVLQIDPVSGEFLQKIILPAPNVTSCAFGGPDLKTLYITTARIDLTDEQLRNYPLSGGVFSIKPGVQGVRSSLYKTKD